MNLKSTAVELLMSKKNNSNNNENKNGCIYLVATPIGNLEDITLRALNILKTVDVIAAEDTRHTGIFLAHYDIKKRLLSYHEHNEKSRANEIIKMALEGMKIAVVSDAGTPGISDPGYIVVRLAIEAGIDIIPIPGPTAFVAALTTSGLNTDEFTFIGFLPRKKTKRVEKLEEFKEINTTMIFYESPHRLEDMLEDVFLIFGDRECCITREITKKFEEMKRGLLSDMLRVLKENGPKGEYVIVVEGYLSYKERNIEPDGKPIKRIHENKYAKYSKFSEC